MGWTSNYISTEQRMELILEGIIDFDTLKKAAHANLEKAKKHGVDKHLVDCAAMTLKVNRSELFELPSQLYPSWGMDLNTRIALIEPKDIDAKVKAQFYVYSMKKLGWDSAMFPNRKKALEWLKKD